MKILLTHGYFLHEDVAEQKIMMPYPPQGLLHINAFLSKHNVSSSIFDTTFSSMQEFKEFLHLTKPDLLGFYCNLLTRINIIQIIRHIRDDGELNKTIIVLGGPDVKHHSMEYLVRGADFCVVGEGEETFLELVTRLSAHNPVLSDIAGLVFKNPDRTVTSAPDRILMRNIDVFPFPDFDQVPITKYFDAWKTRHGHTALTVSTMRGCPYTCQWCSKAVFGNTYRRRSPSVVCDELARLKKKYHPDQYWFVDDVFTISKPWLNDFCSCLEEKGMSIRYECITRADKMDQEIIDLLNRTGCFRVWIGAESGSQRILDQMDRRVEAEQVREMIIASKKAGIETGTFIMLGYPGETIKDIRETVHHLKLANPDLFTCTLAYPIKGTTFYKEVSGKMNISGEWGTYTDRDIDFKRTYPKGFYKHALRYLHHEHTAHKIKKDPKGSKRSLLIHQIISLISSLCMNLYRS